MQKGDMSLAAVLIPMWVLTTALIVTIIEARPDPTASTTSAHIMLLEEQPIAHFSSKMEAQSPGVPEVRVIHHQDLNKSILIALIVASTLLVGILLFLSCCWIYRQKLLNHSNGKRQKTNEVSIGTPLSALMVEFNSLRLGNRKGSVVVFSYQLLEAATDKFSESNVLGEGSSGPVYRASFDGKFIAAVKRVNSIRQDAEREFENEVNWLGKILHQNIIKLLGYCVHGKTRFLVYEMMQNGSLETQLYGPNHGSFLTWHLRLKIAVDVARGLEYLHEHCHPPVVHRDLKSSNILLDSNFNAKLSDFGATVTSGMKSKESIKLSGNLGCVAPEYNLDGKLTDKSDVYAFGVVLLELLMGRKLVEHKAIDESQSIITWAMPQLTDRSRLPNIVDRVIKDTMDLKHLYQVAAVAVLCVQPEPSYRPLMTDVLHSLIPLVPVDLGGSLRIADYIPSVSAEPSN
ncbi:PREDICTED: probable receptor-like protein kinase At1g80640 isoform X1 [Fragaria vesca subsp. vesca]|uniref:probable receptor-like protein kinase At1g80640 isoform X1 n=1 Tax=Fragaria vesca subsp. vesca TaxID=101020 RepID=UPI0002C3213D|nr:PREDICTED: probable receptor-like protein kinase At1g80640 isoform X1 [Fragaria vesca subsp. vesca]